MSSRSLIRGVYNNTNRRNQMKLHLGCGKRDFGPDWINIDGGNYPHLHSHDITKLPFEDNSVELIYASHVIEYFDQTEVLDLLAEWRRVLVEGGTLRVAVPNFYEIARLYLVRRHELNKFIGPLFGRHQMGNTTIYHKTTYDEYSLTDILDIVGFKNCRRYNWRQTEHAQFDDHSQAYIPHMDKDHGTLISLNIEALK